MTALAGPIATVIVAILAFFGITDPDVAEAVKVLVSAVLGFSVALHVVLAARNKRHRINKTAEVAHAQVTANAQAMTNAQTAQAPRHAEVIEVTDPDFPRG